MVVPTAIRDIAASPSSCRSPWPPGLTVEEKSLQQTGGGGGGGGESKSSGGGKTTTIIFPRFCFSKVLQDQARTGDARGAMGIHRQTLL